MLHIFIDADACPVKEQTCRVAARYGLAVTLVANSVMRLPDQNHVDLVVVRQGMDEADDWIVEHASEGDVVITGDIPLAYRALQKGAAVLGTTGRRFTVENVGDALATRELLSELRGAGEVTGGPPPFSKRDSSRFLQELDAIVNEIRRG